MILRSWMFILLIIGMFGTVRVEDEHPDIYEACFDELFEQLPQALHSKVLHVSEKMRKDIISCMQTVFKSSKLLGFVDLYGSSKKTEYSCHSLSGCSDEEDDQEDKKNKYSFLHCLDDHMPFMVECLGNSMIDTQQYFTSLPDPVKGYNDVAYLCKTVNSYVPCAKKVSIQKCGKDATDLIIKEVKREYKGYAEFCDEIRKFERKNSKS